MGGLMESCITISITRLLQVGARTDKRLSYLEKSKFCSLMKGSVAITVNHIYIGAVPVSLKFGYITEKIKEMKNSRIVDHLSNPWARR